MKDTTDKNTAGSAGGRLTIPTDLDIVPQTLELMEKWGADALRDCDGTEFPSELKDSGARIYATYYTTRKNNDWAKAHPEEIQQCYIMTSHRTAAGEGELTIAIMEGISDQLLKPNSRDGIGRWWEVIDRTADRIVPFGEWSYDGESGLVHIAKPHPWHEYTVSFLAYIMWDPVHMYNSVVNDWDQERQMTFDVRQPATKEWSLNRLRRFLEEKPYVDVVRFTTFFHQFTLVFDELKREKYVDWYGYSASVSPYILEQYEKEVGYPFRPEYIIDQGYYNNQYRIPSKEFRDFMAFQRREVASLVKEMTDIVHEYGKEAMMFLGDHWIGTEPYMEEFRASGVDAIVGSVGNGSTLRLISDIPGVKYTEGRMLPYFFPDTFYPGASPLEEAKRNWVTARRAFLRKPVDRIGFGGYLGLTLDFPEFLDFVKSMTEEFRTLYDALKGAAPFTFKRVAVLNSWGKMRSWGAHMVHHAIYFSENEAYAGVPEILSGLPHEVSFISFEDIRTDRTILDDLDVIINVGDEGTAHSGGDYWADPEILEGVREFVHRGGGFVGIGEPSALKRSGRIFQLASVLGVEKENGFTLGYDRYNREPVKEHFILEGADFIPQLGNKEQQVYALDGTDILMGDERSVRLTANSFGEGRAVYLSGLPYSLANARLLHRILLWCSHSEDMASIWSSSNHEVDVHAYPESGRFCVVNNTSREQETLIYLEKGVSRRVTLEPDGILWDDIPR